MNVNSYSAIANGAFAPLYPYYASVIVEKTGVRKGFCLDAGCGGGHLGMALAEITDLNLCLLDQSAKMLALATSNLHMRGMADRARLVEASVESIPLPSNSFDLVVSRGSIPFWSDLRAAFCEICRVLRPDGHAYLGGGLGPAEMRAKIQHVMRKHDPEWQTDKQRAIPRRSVTEYSHALHDAGIRGFHVQRGDEGTWIHFTKQ